MKCVLKRFATAVILLIAVVPGQHSNISGKELGQVRQISSEGGTVTEGFQLLINTEKDSFSAEESIQIQFKLRNTTRQVLVVKEIAAWYDYAVNVSDESGQKVSLTEKGKKLELMRQGKRDELKVKFTKLKAGQELKDSLDITELYAITPGSTYFIIAKRNVYTRNGKGIVEIISNTVKISVVR